MESRVLFYLLLTGVTLFRVWYAGIVELSLDEAYYWLWSLYPSLSYFDHPPMVAWMIWLTTLFDDSERFVRLPAILCSFGATAFLYELAADLFHDRKVGFMAGVIALIAPVYAIGAFVVTPDAPLLLFWCAALWAGWKLLDTQEPKWWYVIGFFFGLAMVSKYTAAFFAPSLFLFLLAAPGQRAWLFRKEPWLGFALGLILFAPVIVWNAQHEWVSIGFQLTHGFKPHHWRPLADFGEFWGLQIVLYGVVLFGYLIAAMIAMGRRGWRRGREEYLYLFMMSAPMFLFFVVNSMRARMEGNWPVMAYAAIIAALPGWIALTRRTTRGGWIVGLLTAAVFTGVLHTFIADPFVPFPQRREISRRVYGWNALGEQTNQRIDGMPKGTFVLTERFQIMSLMTYYTPGRPATYMIDGANRFPYLPDPEGLKGRDALYLVETERLDKDRLAPFFDRMEPAGEYVISRYGEEIRRFTFYRCYNYHGGLIRT